MGERFEKKSFSGTSKDVQIVPIAEKYALSVNEAVEYSGIGRDVIIRLLSMPNCPFLLIVGPRKRLIKRKKFVEYLNNHSDLPAELAGCVKCGG